jgi:hypothetical protein
VGGGGRVGCIGSDPHAQRRLRESAESKDALVAEAASDMLANVRQKRGVFVGRMEGGL